MFLASCAGASYNLDDSRARAYCACSRCECGLSRHFTLLYPFSPLSPSLWETARYSLKYCLKGPLGLKQPTNQLCVSRQCSGLWVVRLMWTCTQNLQTRINTFYPQAVIRNTAAEMFRIVWLSVSGKYTQILLHLSLGQQSYRGSFEDEVTTRKQLPQRLRKLDHKEEKTCFATSQSQNHQLH